MHGTGLGQAQRALLGTIDDGLSAVGRAQDDLDNKAHLPPLGDDAVSIKIPTSTEARLYRAKASTFANLFLRIYM